MAKITEALGDVFKSKVLGIKSSLSKKSEGNSPALFKIVGKNFMALSSMARDLNVASQNVKELVKLMGGKVSEQEDKVAGSGLTEEEREKKLDVELEKLKPVPKETKKEEKKPSFISKGISKLKAKGVDKFKNLKKSFGKSSILKSLTKYLAIATLIGVIFVSFKDSILEWVSGLWDAIKESFNSFLTTLKDWFNEVVQPIIDKVVKFIDEWIIQPVSNFFDGLVGFLKDYFGFWYDLITSPFETVKRIWDKVMSGIMALLDKLPDWLKEKLGIPKKAEAAPVDDTAEKRKLERQQKEAIDTERVRKQEEEKKYKGEDEIVRKRLGIEEKTTTMRAEEAKKKERIEIAPKPEPTIVPSPTATPPAKAEAKPAPAPAAPTPAAPSGKAAEPAPSLPQEGPVATVVKALEEQGITNNFTKIAVLANIKKEVGKDMQPKSENLAAYAKTSNARIKEVFTTRVAKYSDAELDEIKKDPVRFGEVIYGKDTKLGQGMGNTKEGDGYKYRGRGYIQFTGKNNYDSLGKAIKEDLVGNPDKVNDPFIAAKMTAAFIIRGLKNKVNEFTSQTDANRAVTQAVGGSGLNLDTGVGAKILAKVEAESAGFSGSSLSSTSTQVASGQREQQKPSTPNVINAPTTNTTVVKQSQVASAPKKDTGSALTARAA